MSVRGLLAIAAAAAGLVLAGASPATPLLPAQKAALEAVHRAVAAGHLDAASAAADRAEIGRAARLIRGLPSGRREHVATALAQVGAFRTGLTAPRAAALFGQLKANDDYFAKHYAPADKTDVTAADGVVYRYFAGRCLEFHPLANFGALNARVAAGDEAGTKLLADALVARGIYQRGGGIGWEYYFSFGGGRAPWLSGMAQAVAAQAFARAAGLVTAESAALLREAHAAYRTIPGRLLTSVAAGPWIRLYAFQATPVLNAQLQAVLSLQSYAADAEDTAAGALAARMQHAAAATLTRFDTGYWTLYSLRGDPSPLDYSQYVVQLLTKLAGVDPRFADAARRFASYLHQPPAFKLLNGGLGQVRFWLSKPSTVQVETPAGPSRRLALGDGWHTLTWKEPARPGVYPVRLQATDWASNHGALESLPIVRVGAGGRGVAEPTAAVDQPAFGVGAALEDPSQGVLAQQLGFRIARVGVAWPAGAAAPDPSVVAALQKLSASTSAVIELIASPLPADDAGRAALAQYAAALVSQLRSVRAVILAPAPVAGSVATYAAALAAIEDAVPGTAVGPLIDGASIPRSIVLALVRGFVALGRAAPYAGIVALHPAPVAAAGQWTAASVPQLIFAFGGTAPPVLIDGLGTPTLIPPARAYPSGTPPGTASPADQAAAYASAITVASCSTTVAGVILDRLIDSATVPAPPTGLYYPDGSAKASAAPVAATVAPAQRGILVCPGAAVPAAASRLVFPATAGGAVVLGCARDCLYLVTLDDAGNSPLAARRGTLRGGAAPVTVALPKLKLDPAATYRLDVRLVDQVNPAPVVQVLSDPLPGG